MERIPFNRPFLAGRELEYIQGAIDARHLSGDGFYTRECQRLIADLLGAHRVFLTHSCTAALEMSAILLDIQEGDEVIIPSFTFVSTVNAFVLRGARPVFADIRPDTLNLDASLLESLITPATKAIVPVHYAGVGCEMTAILEIARRHRVEVVEDNAHGLFGLYEGRHLGTFGRLATLSFHETKNITCGEGGALLINDPLYVERAEIIREKGTDRSRFFRGQVDKYSWVDIGSSYLPADILAAYLYAQLEARQQIQAKRQQIWEYYHHHLRDWAAASGVELPFIPDNCSQAYHLFYLLMPTSHLRGQFIDHLNAHQIDALFHYVPLHLSRMGQSFGGKIGDCPVTESASARLVRLPFHSSLTDEDLSRVVETITRFDA